MQKSDNKLFTQQHFLFFWAHITYKCNLNCQWCYVYNKLGKKTVTDMILPLFIKSLRLAQSLKINEIIFIGGEPTLHPQFPIFIKEAKQRGFTTHVVTNGILLSNKDYLNKIRVAGIDFITMSFASHLEKKYDTVTRSHNLYQKAVEAIKNVVTSKTPFSINIVIDKNTVTHYYKQFRFLENLGVSEINLLSCEPPYNTKSMQINHPNHDVWGLKIKVKVKNSLPTPTETAQIMEKLFIWGQKYTKLKLHFQAAIPACLFNQNILKQLIRENRFHPNYVAHLGNAFVVDPNSYIYPASHWIDTPLFSLYKQKSLKTLLSKKEFLEKWNSGKSIKFRKMLWHYPSKECQDCPLWEKYCVGGNPLLSLSYDLGKIITTAYKKCILPSSTTQT